MTTYLVTGASGFLGSHVIEDLVSRGLKARALVRRSEQLPGIEALGAECVLGSLDSVDGVREAVRGVDGVIHCAGGGKVDSVEGFHANNVTTTEHLLAAIDAEQPPLKRFVLVSSLSAHGPSPDGIPPAPRGPPPPPPPRDTRWLPMFRGAARGVLPMVGGQRHTSLIYGEDCARALGLLATIDHPTGWIGCIEDGHRYDWQLLGELIVEAVGRRAHTLKVPVAALGLAARVNEYVGRLRHRPVALNRDKFEDMRQPFWVCRADALRALGWSPQVGFAEGTRLTARWYREQGWL